MARVSQVITPRSFADIADDEVDISTERDARHLRSPMILSTSYWLNQGKYIALHVNPLNTQWSLPRRETITKTAAGTVRNTWRNRYRNTYYDEFEVSFTFQSGSLLPSARVPSYVYRDPALISRYLTNPSPPKGLEDFYRFLSMIDQPLLMGQAENRHIIMYRSRLFPTLRMTGYWLGTTPVSFTDDGTSGNKATWTATFQCYRTYPSLWSWRGEKLSSAWREWAVKNGQEVISKGAIRRAQGYAALDAPPGAVNAVTPGIPPNPPDPDVATKIQGRRANTGTKTIGLVTGDVQPTTGAGAGKRVVSPTNTPQQVTTTVNSTNVPVPVTTTVNE